MLPSIYAITEVFSKVHRSPFAYDSATQPTVVTETPLIQEYPNKKIRN
jgi:hypothetical protein